MQLVHTELDWSGPARWGDDVRVGVLPVRLGSTSFTLQFDVRANDRRICLGQTVYVVIATDGSGKIPIPDRLRAVLS